MYSVPICPIACVLLEYCLRFLEERKEIMEKFAKEQDAFFRDAQEKHTHELQLLQQGHQQQLQALRMELETKHHSELAKQLASLESRQQVLLETHVAELQVKHNAEINALEMRHLSNLDALESCYLADIQTIQDEHRKALELLRAERKEQLQKKDSSHKELFTLELEKLKLKHNEELQSAKDSLRVRMHARHTEPGKNLATDLQGAQQVRCWAPSLIQDWSPYYSCMGHMLYVSGHLCTCFSASCLTHLNVSESCTCVSCAHVCLSVYTSLC